MWLANRWGVVKLRVHCGWPPSALRHRRRVERAIRAARLVSMALAFASFLDILALPRPAFASWSFSFPVDVRPVGAPTESSDAAS